MVGAVDGDADGEAGCVGVLFGAGDELCLGFPGLEDGVALGLTTVIGGAVEGDPNGVGCGESRLR